MGLIQTRTIFLKSKVWTDYPSFVSMYYTYFEVGNVSARLKMDCWRERYVEVESVIIGSVHHVSQNDVFVRCKSRIANSVVLNISIIGHYSIELLSRDDDQTSPTLVRSIIDLPSSINIGFTNHLVDSLSVSFSPACRNMLKSLPVRENKL